MSRPTIDSDIEEEEEESYFCGDLEPHEKHDDEGTASGRIFVHTCHGHPINLRRRYDPNASWNLPK